MSKAPEDADVYRTQIKYMIDDIEDALLVNVGGFLQKVSRHIFAFAISHNFGLLALFGDSPIVDSPIPQF